jgi:hypothetical protein
MLSRFVEGISFSSQTLCSSIKTQAAESSELKRHPERRTKIKGSQKKQSSTQDSKGFHVLSTFKVDL